MQLRFLGKGSGFSLYNGNTSAFLKEGNKSKQMLLIDCGGSVLNKLLRCGILDDVELLDVLLTHLHSDHAGSLPNLAQYMKWVKNSKLNIYLPENSEYINDVENMLQIGDVSPDWINLESESSLDGKYESFDRARYIKTRHSNFRPSFSLDFESTNGDVFYTGDTSEPTHVARKLVQGRPIKQIYADMATISGDPVHTSVNDFEILVNPSKRHLVTGMHFNDFKTERYAQTVGFNVPEVVR
ncbi:MAG: MBL fold metallo-hydrolase [Firmicutes bacterium]|nr:MBL fold metallo-hydrolase [Bacillota bacterium]